MKRRGLVPALALTAATLGAASLAAQSSGPSVDLSVGVSRGQGGEFVQRGGIAAAAFLGKGVSANGVVLGLDATLQGPVATQDARTPLPEGGCVPEFPLLASLAALVGLEARVGSRAALRALVGPALFLGAENGDGRVGARLRGDLVWPLPSRLAAVVSMGGGALRTAEGDVVWPTWAGVGVRLR
jgi:hypothetical protein